MFEVIQGYLDFQLGDGLAIFALMCALLLLCAAFFAWSTRNREETVHYTRMFWPSLATVVACLWVAEVAVLA